ncbi:MAG: hypothetical protein Q9165_005789 [Trypethelium subeluteriae]
MANTNSSDTKAGGDTDTWGFIRRIRDASGANDLSQVQALVRDWRSDPAVSDPSPAELSYALVDAARAGRPEIVGYLVEEGAKTDTSVAIQVATSGSAEALQIVAKHGFDINAWNPNGHDAAPPFIAALRSGINADVVRWFLENGADVNAEDSRGTPALAWAAHTSSVPVVEMLLQHGAKLEGSRALSAAASSRPANAERMETVKFLLDQGADINAIEPELPWTFAPVYRTPRKSGTALHAASKFGKSEDMVQLLLDSGADPNSKDSDGLTPAEAAEKFQKE